MLEMAVNYAQGVAVNQSLDFTLQWVGDGGPTEEMTSAELAGHLFPGTIGIANAVATANAAAALRTLATRDDGVAAMTAQRNETRNAGASASDYDELATRDDGFVKALGSIDLKEWLGDVGNEGIDKILRRVNKKQDRSRVSMEPHEWRYCRDSNAINQIYDLAGVQKEDTLNHSYPAWVGAPKMRKAVQEMRLINRCLRSRGVTKVLQVLGLANEDFFDGLLSKAKGGQGALTLRMQEAVAQFKSILDHTEPSA